jgi:predicted transcriptional regulator
MGIKISKRSKPSKKSGRYHGNILGDFADILKCAKNEVSISEIQRLIKKDKHYIMEYANFLTKKNLLKCILIKKRKKYKITKKGFKYLKKYYEIMKILGLK